MASITEKRKKLSKKKSYVAARGQSVRKSRLENKQEIQEVQALTRSNEEPEDFKANELKEDYELDKFIYGFQDDIVSKALEQVTEKRKQEEIIRDFVNSFCKAWLKLVKWRWMKMDNDTSKIVHHLNDTEPTPSSKEPWLSNLYSESTKVPQRISLPTVPNKYSIFSKFNTAEEIQVVKPVKERLSRYKRMQIEPEELKIKEKTMLGSISKSEYLPGDKCSEPQQRFIHAVPKTAFPEKVTAKIVLGPQVSMKRSNSSSSLHETDLNFTEKEIKIVNNKSKNRRKHKR